MWLHELIKLLPNIALATIILVIGFFIAKWIKKFVLRFFEKIVPNQTLVSLFTSLVYIFLLGIVIFSALSVLQLSKAVTSLLAGAGILGLALAFAFQDIASNFMPGIFLSIKKPGFLEARHDVIMQIKKAFDDNDILIHFPVRTMDFGANGSAPLQEMPIKVNGLDKE